MIFSFVFFFFKRSMQIPIKIPTGSIQEIRGLLIELYGHISTRRLRRLDMAKSGENPKCSFFITKSAVEPTNE
jgi:hypothetical protein